MPDADLADVLADREVRAVGIKDFFDLADALLQPDSIRIALSRLNRSELEDLVAHSAGEPGGDLAEARRLALVVPLHDERYPGAPPGPVVAAPDLVPQAVHTEIRLVAPMLATAPPRRAGPTGSEPSDRLDAVAAETAFGTVTAIGELLAELAQEPARELARGGLAAGDARRIAAAMGVDEGAALWGLARRARMVRLDAGHWHPAGPAVLDGATAETTAERWSALLTRWRAELPTSVDSTLTRYLAAADGRGLADMLAQAYPLSGIAAGPLDRGVVSARMHDILSAVPSDAALLGLIALDRPSGPGREREPHRAADAMRGLMPPEVEQVYLQHDLSIVAPGPLIPRLDARLRSMADVEGRALASRYRLSAESLFRAMVAGETSQSIREFLGALSLTGMPQPVDYLIGDASARFGLVRVGVAGNGRTYVRSADATLLASVRLDRQLAALGFTSRADRLESRFDVPTVVSTLSQARYPVAAEDADGSVVTIPVGRSDGADDPNAPPRRVAELIQRLRVGTAPEQPGDEGAWLSRQLEVAIRGKLGLAVTVRMPDGTTIRYELEPSSVASGRLRARDRTVDIERTLPLSSITAVGPL